MELHHPARLIPELILARAQSSALYFQSTSTTISTTNVISTYAMTGTRCFATILICSFQIIPKNCIQEQKTCSDIW